MPKDHEKQRLFSRRAVILGGAQAATALVLAGRLAYLQLFKSGEYTSLSESNHVKLLPIAAERGFILDRNGLIIADNKKNYRLFLDASSLTAQAYRATLEKLAAFVTIPDKKMEQLKSVRPSAASGPQLVKDNLTWEEVSTVELHTLSLPGAFIEAGQLRNYPLAEKTAHLTGYMGAASETEMETDEEKALLRVPDFKIGKNGVEKMLEMRLRGKAAIRKLEVNVHGVVVREIGKTESAPGENVRLTIDRPAQDVAAERIKGQSAAVVALEIATGNILVLASMPAYDPNSFSLGITTDEWKQLAADKKIPLLNKAVGGLYPPGSTFKMIVGLAGLKEGIIKPGFSVFCPGFFMLGNHRFGCWKQGGHGPMDYHHALEQSCDTFFYTVAQRMGPQPSADIAKKLGLGKLYNIGISGEKAGIVPDPAWKTRYFKNSPLHQRWTAGDTINCSIGQGYVLSNPIELAVMTARIASGRAVTPRLLVPKSEENPEFPYIDIDAVDLVETREGMVAVVNGPGGTAGGSRISDPRYAFAGKTGTSQVRRLIAPGMNQNALPWEARHHGLFVGFAPIENPKYAVAVVVEHGGSGAGAAAPVAKDVLFQLQRG